MLPEGAHCLGRIAHSSIRSSLLNGGHNPFTPKICFILFQLVMEYCLGSASDLLEGKFKARAVTPFPFHVDPDPHLTHDWHLCVSDSVPCSSQEASARSGNRCNYPRCSSRVGLPSFPQDDSPVGVL